MQYHCGCLLAAFTILASNASAQSPKADTSKHADSAKHVESKCCSPSFQPKSSEANDSAIERSYRARKAAKKPQTPAEKAHQDSAFNAIGVTLDSMRRVKEANDKKRQ